MFIFWGLPIFWRWLKKKKLRGFLHPLPPPVRVGGPHTLPHEGGGVTKNLVTLFRTTFLRNLKIMVLFL